MQKIETGFILIGFEFPELEGKNCQLNNVNHDKKIKDSRNQKLNGFLLIKDEVINFKCD